MAQLPMEITVTDQITWLQQWPFSQTHEPSPAWVPENQSDIQMNIIVLGLARFRVHQ